MTLRVHRILGVAAAIAITPLALAACSAPTAVVTPTPTATALDPAKPDTTPAPSDVAAGFKLLFDDSGIVSVDAPDTWTDVSTSPLTAESGLQLYNLTASPDLNAYTNGWDVPGVSVSSTNDPSALPQTFIDNLKSAIGPQCEDGQTGDYDDTVYVGTYLFFPNCGETSTDFLGVVVQDNAKTHVVVVTIQMVSDKDKSTIRDEILNTFYAIYP
jgi:serine protease Do